MKAETLKEILSKTGKPVFWTECSSDELASVDSLCETDPASLCVGQDVTITDRSEPLNDRRQRLAEKIGIHFSELIEEDLTNDEFTLRTELREDWLFDKELELQLEPVCRSIIAMVNASFKVADPIVAELTLTPETLSVIRELMGCAQ